MLESKKISFVKIEAGLALSNPFSWAFQTVLAAKVLLWPCTHHT